MRMPLFKVTVKDSRKGVIIYSTIILLYAMLIILMYPSFADDLSDPMAQGDGILLQEEGIGESGERSYNLSWDSRVGSSYHIALGAKDPLRYEYFSNLIQGNKTFIDPDLVKLDDLIENRTLLSSYGIELLYLGAEKEVHFERVNETAFFWVLFVTSETNLTPVEVSDSVSTMDLVITSTFSEIAEGNKIYEGMLGTDDIDFSTLKGFINIEFFSMWLLFLVIFLCIKAGGSVSKHIEDKSMDILLATGYSRERFMFEKLLAQMVFLVAVCFGAFLGLVLGTLLIGEPVPLAPYALVLLGSIPIALAFIGIALVISTLVDEGAKVTALMMGLVVGQYVMMIIVNLSSWGDWLKYFSILSYFNNTEMMNDTYLDPVNVVVPLILFGVFTGAAFLLFRRKEIHA